MKKITGLVLATTLLLAAASGCTTVAQGATQIPTRSQVEAATAAIEEAAADPVSPEASPTAVSAADTAASIAAAQEAIEDVVTDLPDYSTATTILLGDPITVDGPGASVEGSTVRITAGGSYRVSGTMDDGQIIVDVQGKEEVYLELAGVDLTSAHSAPIYVLDAQAVVLTLAKGTQNYLADGETYILDDPEAGEPDAAIWSKTDLVINGSGALIVDARYRHGIVSRDDLTIADADITVNAAGHGIRGRDSLVITNATITIDAGEDGLKSNYDEDPERGFVSIDGGVIQIVAGQDGIQAESSVLIRNSDITIVSGGGSIDSSQRVTAFRDPRTGGAVASDDTPSTKGIKARVDLTIEGGTIRIDALDDALHSDGTLTINDGEFTLASGDDAIHADEMILINGGTIDILRSYEGIESAVIVINAGQIHIVASDDGINAASGNAGGGMPMGGRPGQGGAGFDSGNRLEIHGGYIVVDAGGDGVDVNGSILMTGGTLLVNGPTVNMQGALDYDQGFTMTGGFLVAVGSAGMAQAPDASSTQHAVMINFPSVLAAGTPVHIEGDDGGVLTFVPSKQYQSVVLSSPELERGGTYTVYTGGNATGTVTDGLYTDGTYTPGTQAASFTISEIVTRVGTAGGGMTGRGRR
jgi:hypothetical protein